MRLWDKVSKGVGLGIIIGMLVALTGWGAYGAFVAVRRAAEIGNILSTLHPGVTVGLPDGTSRVAAGADILNFLINATAENLRKEQAKAAQSAPPTEPKTTPDAPPDPPK